MDGVESNKVQSVGADDSREGGGIKDGVESNIIQAVGADGSRYVGSVQELYYSGGF